MKSVYDPAVVYRLRDGRWSRQEVVEAPADGGPGGYLAGVARRGDTLFVAVTSHRGITVGGETLPPPKNGGFRSVIVPLSP